MMVAMLVTQTTPMEWFELPTWPVCFIALRCQNGRHVVMKTLCRGHCIAESVNQIVWEINLEANNCILPKQQYKQ